MSSADWLGAYLLEIIMSVLKTLQKRFDHELLPDHEVYLVGGAIRDALLGLPVHDCDWLVVGVTPAEMISRGFLPVGEDFPVFLHPKTREEYALARTERKVAQGYGGFQFYTGVEVSLEQDLQRRDLTINAIAMDRDGQLHDPFSGQADIIQLRLRHVSLAFQEDPVRILRLARFLARFTQFEVDPETQQLCQLMVKKGEVHALQAQRVWKEVSRALMAKQASRMWDFLSEVGAAEIIFRGQVLACQRLDMPQSAKMSLPERFALIAQEANLSILKPALSLPNDCEDLTMLVKKLRPLVKTMTFQAQEVLKVLEQGDALRRFERFKQALGVLFALGETMDWAFWKAARDILAQLPVAQIAHQASEPSQIPYLIRQARCEALRQWLINDLG